VFGNDPRLNRHVSGTSQLIEMRTDLNCNVSLSCAMMWVNAGRKMVPSFDRQCNGPIYHHIRAEILRRTLVGTRVYAAFICIF
jgi:hypothetical protein